MKFSRLQKEPDAAVQDFLAALRKQWPLLPPLGQGNPQEMGAALGRFLSQRETQYAHLRARLDACETARASYARGWQECQDDPVYAQLADVQAALQETERDLRDCEQRMSQTRQNAERLKAEIEQLQAQIREQQSLIAHQQVRLLELEDPQP